MTSMPSTPSHTGVDVTPSHTLQATCYIHLVPPPPLPKASDIYECKKSTQRRTYMTDANTLLRNRGKTFNIS